MFISYAMILVPILLYFPALLLTFALVHRENSKIWHWGLIACLTAFGIAALFLAIFWGEQMGGLFYTVILIGFVFPLLFIGAGMGLGGYAKALRLKGLALFSTGILGGSLILPAIGFGLLFYGTNQKIKVRKNERHQYQSQTITDKLGSHVLNIPISPQLDLWHSCSAIKSDSTNTMLCSEGQYDKNFATRNVSQREPFAPTLKRIDFRVPHKDCKSRHYGIYPCIKRTTQRAWCERRHDVIESIWCSNALRNKLSYEGYSLQKVFATKSIASRWRTQATLEDTINFEGNPIQIDCNTTRDNLIASQEKSEIEASNEQPQSRFCRVKYRIEKDIEVTAKFNVLGPETLILQAHEAYDYAQDFWVDMKTREMK